MSAQCSDSISGFQSSCRNGLLCCQQDSLWARVTSSKAVLSCWCCNKINALTSSCNCYGWNQLQLSHADDALSFYSRGSCLSVASHLLQFFAVAVFKYEIFPWSVALSVVKKYLVDYCCFKYMYLFWSMDWIVSFLRNEGDSANRWRNELCVCH